MSQYQDLFTARVAVLATMHYKEQVMQPILERDLGVRVTVPREFDTDCLGTFTHEIDRPGSQLKTARLKAEKALAFTGQTLAIASEGSFGPHPSCPFLASNLELVLLLDAQHNVEIVGQSLSTETNYAQQEISSLEEALLFARKIGFPEHGLIVFSESHPGSPECCKGIVSEAQLLEIVRQGLHRSARAKVRIETDMRALYNPTRMGNIAQATEDLVAKIRSRCPHCGLPGFTVVRTLKGLPCEWCHSPTGLVLAEVYECQKCSFARKDRFPEGVEYAQPAYCPYCNP